eukprot:gene32668-40309_t
MVLWGGLMGVANYVGSITQTIGMITETAGETGFIVGMYVIFVPILEWFISGFRNTLSVYAWVASIVSVVGLFLLSGCVGEDEDCFANGFSKGEYYGLASMVGWAAVLIFNDYGCRTVDAISITLMSLVVALIISIPMAFIMEPDQMTWPFTAARTNIPMIVAASLTETAALVGTSIGQKYVRASRSALILSQESVSAALFGFIFLKEVLTWIEFLGCVLMLGAAVFSSLLDVWFGDKLDKQEVLQRIDEEEEMSFLLSSSGEEPNMPTMNALYGSCKVDDEGNLITHRV